MSNDENCDRIDPVGDDLDLETLRAVQRLIRGFSETSPAKPPTDLSPYRAGKHDAYSTMMAILSCWIDDLEQEHESDDSISNDREGRQ